MDARVDLEIVCDVAMHPVWPCPSNEPFKAVIYHFVTQLDPALSLEFPATPGPACLGLPPDLAQPSLAPPP